MGFRFLIPGLTDCNDLITAFLKPAPWISTDHVSIT